MSAQDLNSAMRRRRGELGLNVVAASAASGVSRGTWTELEKGVRLHVTAPTLYKVDRALEWEAGTAMALFDRASGGGTKKVAPVAKAAPSASIGAKLDEVLVLLREVLARLD